MSNTITATQVRTWYNANWTGGSTQIAPAYTHAVGVRSDRASSQLGDRSNIAGGAPNPNFRSILIFITDSTSQPPTNVGCFAQGNGIGGGTGSDFDRVVALFCGANTSVPPQQSYMDEMSCTNGPTSTSSNNFSGDQYQFGVNASVPTDTSAVAAAIAGAVCGIPPDCSCPTGYTLVYPKGDVYTEASGSCEPDNPPICRKISCDCPTPPFNGAETTETGNVIIYT
ncbi:MAG: hypothetical protein CM15mV42_0640 [uncultured marine virus]|nr:MAG: hypothetical protein CM15mV42_0640 [uncultured marine virus]